MSTFTEFLRRFRFDPSRRGWLGIERERFVVAEPHSQSFTPKAPEFLAAINDSAWTYELSACQVEDRTKARRDIAELSLDLTRNDNNAAIVASTQKLFLSTIEAAPYSRFPLSTYPDPRYREIAQKLSREQFMAALTIIGTHVHLGVGSMDEALTVYDALREHLDALCALGDHSHGERLARYKVVTGPSWHPPKYHSVSDLYEDALDHRFAENPRNCWHLIRVSTHGTVECRMFGATEHIDEILEWASTIHYIAH